MVDPLGNRDDQALSVLIGRPIAVVRAKLQLRLNGNPAYNQSWGATFQDQAAELSELNFQVRLGSLELRHDGLMGYYLGDTYTKFNSVHYPEGLTPATPAYIAQIGKDANYLTLQFNENSTAFITLLLDPRGGVHASTGILPVKDVLLPPEYFEAALARMEVTFRTGPLLLEPETVRMPKPAERHGTWSWVQRTGTDSTDWEQEPIVKATQDARLIDVPLALRDGWLKLSNTEDSDQT